MSVCMQLSVCLSACVYVCLYTAVCLSVCLRICLSVCLCICLSVCSCLSVLSACVYVCLYTAVCLSVCVQLADGQWSCSPVFCKFQQIIVNVRSDRLVATSVVVCFVSSSSFYCCISSQNKGYVLQPPGGGALKPKYQTVYNHTYNGRPIGSCTCCIKRHHLQWPWTRTPSRRIKNNRWPKSRRKKMQLAEKVCQPAEYKKIIQLGCLAWTTPNQDFKVIYLRNG